MAPLQCKQGSQQFAKYNLVAMQQRDRQKEKWFDTQQSMCSEQWSDSVGKYYEATAK